MTNREQGKGCGVWVWAFGFGVWDSRYGVWGLEFEVSTLGLGFNNWIWARRFGVRGLELQMGGLMLGVAGCRRHALPPCLPFHLVIIFCIWFRHRAPHVTLPRAQKTKSRILVWGAAAHDAAFTFETQETPTLPAAATRADCPLPAALRRDPSTNATPGGTWDRELQMAEGERVAGRA